MHPMTFEVALHSVEERIRASERNRIHAASKPASSGLGLRKAASSLFIAIGMKLEPANTAVSEEAHCALSLAR